MIVKIWGGLGNQMFQYAFAKVLAVKFNTKVWLDFSGFDTDDFITKRKFQLDIFNIDLPIADQLILKKHRKKFKIGLLNKTYWKIIRTFPNLFKNNVLEAGLNFKEANLRNGRYYEGYWQSEKYFANIKQIVLNNFNFKNELSLSQTTDFQHINSVNSISIHVRRGDYVNNPTVNAYHGNLSEEYYNKAIAAMQTEISEPVFFVFSDDIDWVEKNMFQHINVHYVKSPSAENDLFLMSRCKHQIIANSTFSWWGAYLNTNENKSVYAPLKWFNNDLITTDLIPNEWKRI